MTAVAMQPAPSPLAGLRSAADYLGTIVRHLAGNPSSLFGLVVISVLVVLAVFAPLIATQDPYLQDLQAVLQPPCGGALLRHRRGRARRVQPDRLRLADHPDDHRAGRGHRRADRARGRHDRRLLRRLVRHGADADHRHLPVVPGADPVARLRGGARGRARERHRRDRADLLAADRAAGAGRDADAARGGLRLGGEAAGGVERRGSSGSRSCRCACPRCWCG